MHDLRELALKRRDEYRQASPYPHIVIDSFLDPAEARRIIAEFEKTKSDWIYYYHVNEKKRGFNQLSRMGPATRTAIERMQSPEFVIFLEELTDIEGLRADPDMDGGGLHEMKPGGFLNVHVDFQSHTTRRNWSRKLNLLYYLNEDWQDSYNGCLELWDKDVKRCVKKIKPMFNRCVIFETNTLSYHGVPEPIRCPEGRSRKSVALYYFKDENQHCGLQPTHYRARPSDSAIKRVLIVLDRSLLWVYSSWKRYIGVSESGFTRFLKFFSRGR